MGVTARIIVSGDELLRGFVQDAHVHELARDLRRHGIELTGAVLAADDAAALRRALDTARDADLIIVTGGLGPTHDDRTTQVVAEFVGRDLVLDEVALGIVEQRIRALRGSDPHLDRFDEGNRKQATVPRDAYVLDPAGTAPGYIVETSSGVVVVLPGPPGERRAAWGQVVASDAYARVRARATALHERTVRLWGLPEADLVPVLATQGQLDSRERTVTLCARDGELELSIRGTDATAVDALVDAVHEAVPQHVFATDDERSVAEMVIAAARARGVTLGTAESCTGGLVAGALSSVPGASDVFTGGIVSYATEQKTALLAVPAETIATYGVVSNEVAVAMAEGASRRLGCEVALGITGWAGPGGGDEHAPVGTVCIAIAGGTAQEGADVVRMFMPGDRDNVRRRAVHVALHRLRIALAADSRV